MASRLYGIDFGTSVIKIYKKNNGVIYDSKNIIAVADSEKIIAYGDEAFDMLGKTPSNIEITFPVRNGVIADIENMTALLNSVFAELEKKHGKIAGSEFIVASPTDITEVEKRAFVDLVASSDAKTKKIRIVEKPIANALGAGLDVTNANGVMIVDIGADTTEISVLSLGGIVISKMVPVGGNKFDENIIANGYQTSYVTSQTIGILNYVYVNGVAKTIGTNTEKQLGIYADFYYSPGSNTIEATDNYVAGTVINVIYTPLIKGRQIVYNNNEISRIGQQTGRNGTICRYETRNDVLSSNELNKVAQTYIKYKGTAEISLTIETKNTDLFNIGQQVYFDIPQLPDLQRDYMVKTKETQITQTGTDAVIFYVYTLSSNYESENAINYFDNQRRKANGNINENEFITRNIDIENVANVVFSNVTQTEVTPVGDNVLNSVLNSPFIS